MADFQWYFVGLLATSCIFLLVSSANLIMLVLKRAPLNGKSFKTSESIGPACTADIVFLAMYGRGEILLGRAPAVSFASC
jgi:hypothetical protein